MQGSRPSAGLAFGFLVFFGVGVDMLHITLANPTAYS